MTDITVFERREIKYLVSAEQRAAEIRIRAKI